MNAGIVEVPRAQDASVAQLAEQRFCKPQVVGSSPSAGSMYGIDCRVKFIVGGGFPSGQRGQTVNLMATPSQVRILFPPLVFGSLKGLVLRKKRQSRELLIFSVWMHFAGVAQW